MYVLHSVLITGLRHDITCFLFDDVFCGLVTMRKKKKKKKKKRRKYRRGEDERG